MQASSAPLTLVEQNEPTPCSAIHQVKYEPFLHADNATAQFSLFIPLLFIYTEQNDASIYAAPVCDFK